MEILSDSVFKGEVEFNNDVFFSGSEFHNGGQDFWETTNFRKTVNFYDRADVYFSGCSHFYAGLSTPKIYSVEYGNYGTAYLIPYCTDLTPKTIATTDDIKSLSPGITILSHNEVPVGCNKFFFDTRVAGKEMPTGKSGQIGDLTTEFLLTQVYTNNKLVTMDIGYCIITGECGGQTMKLYAEIAEHSQPIGQSHFYAKVIH